MKKSSILIFFISICSICFTQREKVYTDLNDALKNPLNVYKLDLSYAKLKKLPDVVAQLTNLEELNVAHNRLTNLPETIGKLVKLNYLHASNHNIAKLP